MIKTAKVVGLNSDTEAALTLTSSNEAEERLNFFAIVFCGVEDAFSRARQALSEAETTFFSSDQGVAERLNEAAETIKGSLSDTQDLQFLLASVVEGNPGNVLYILGQGEGLRGYLLRSGKENDLLGMSGGQLVSGVFEAGDRVILATKSLIGFLGDDKILRETPINILEDEIIANLPEAENYPVAAIVLENEKENVGAEQLALSERSEPKGVLPSDKEGNVEAGFMPARKIQLGKIMPHFKNGKVILGVGVFILLAVGLVFFFQQRKGSGVLKNQLEQKASETIGQAKESTSSASTAYQINDIPLWLDLDLIKEGFTAKSLSLSLGKLLVLDEKQKTLVTIGLENKSQQILAGEEKLGEAAFASLNGDLAWVLSENKGLLRVDEDKKVLVVEKPDKEWGEILGLYGFARNAYLLDKLGQVWKYVPVEGGYSDKLKYFKEDIKVDLAGVKRMQIDSSLWILKDNGEILKYTQGSPDYFSFNGLDKPVKDPRGFFVSDETENLYILDSGNNRLLVLDKKGAYKAQYLGDKFSLFEDLVVDEKGKKVYLLDEGQIYLLELK